MSSKSCTIKFFLYSKVSRENKGFAVYARIRYNRQKAEFSTGEYCKDSNWNKKAGCPIRHPRLREYLIHIESKINSIKRDLELANQPISAKNS